MPQQYPYAIPTAGHVVIVGAGLGGLALAMRLAARDCRVTVIDRLDRPGGRVGAIRSNGHRFDLGPVFLPETDALRELYRQCGLSLDARCSLTPLSLGPNSRGSQTGWPMPSHAIQGGPDALALDMARAITARGGTLRLNRQVTRITRDRAGRPDGVLLSNGDTIRADVVVVNGDPIRTADILVGKTPSRKRRARAPGDRLVWGIGTRGTRQKWPDLGPLMDLPERSIDGRRAAIRLHRVSAVDRTAAPDGGDTFQVLCRIAPLRGQSWAGRIERIRQALYAHLQATALPGLDGADISASLCMTPDDLRDRYLLTDARPRGSASALAHVGATAAGRDSMAAALASAQSLGDALLRPVKPPLPDRSEIGQPAE